MLTVGTKVEIIGVTMGLGRKLIGCTGVIIAVEPDDKQCYYVELESYSETFGCAWWVCESDVKEAN